jgi:hypothetical protein
MVTTIPIPGCMPQAGRPSSPASKRQPTRQFIRYQMPRVANSGGVCLQAQSRGYSRSIHELHVTGFDIIRDAVSIIRRTNSQAIDRRIGIIPPSCQALQVVSAHACRYRCVAVSTALPSACGLSCGLVHGLSYGVLVACCVVIRIIRPIFQRWRCWRSRLYPGPSFYLVHTILHA